MGNFCSSKYLFGKTGLIEIEIQNEFFNFR